MTVAASILLAALVGGVVFVLLDSWQRRSAAPAPEPAAWPPEPRTEPLPAWTPEARTEPLPDSPPRRPLWDDPPREDPPPPGLWSGWAGR